MKYSFFFQICKLEYAAPIYTSLSSSLFASEGFRYCSKILFILNTMQRKIKPQRTDCTHHPIVH